MIKIILRIVGTISLILVLCITLIVLCVILIKKKNKKVKIQDDLNILRKDPRKKDDKQKE